jgi:signal transduction histidine kinase
MEGFQITEVTEDRCKRCQLDQSLEVLRLAEEDRRRLGQELHDDVGQLLTAVAFLAESLNRDLEVQCAPAAEQAARIRNYVAMAVAKVRLLTKGLYPVAAYSGALAIALEQLASESEGIFGIECRVVCGESFSSEVPNAAQHLYRIAQEAVRNAVKHGKASRVTIELTQVGGRPRMVITDNGSGFNRQVAEDSSGLGLHIMRRRCHILGLTLTVGRAPNGDTVVSAA